MVGKDICLFGAVNKTVEMSALLAPISSADDGVVRCCGDDGGRQGITGRLFDEYSCTGFQVTLFPPVLFAVASAMRTSSSSCLPLWSAGVPSVCGDYVVVCCTPLREASREVCDQ